jgi:carbon monoxide dehydrogenase subunit G
MKLEFSGSPAIAAPRDRVWERLMEGTARKLTEQFWADFAQRVSQEG